MKRIPRRHRSDPRLTGCLPASQERILLGAAIVWVITWGLLAILFNDRPSGNDSVFPRVWSLLRSFGADQQVSFMDWLRDGEYHPPLPGLFGGLLASLTSAARETVRSGGLLLQLILMFQVRAMVLELTRCRTSALLGFWLAATLPAMAGFFRLDFPEPLVAVLLLATLWAAMGGRLRQLRGAALLGLLVGLGSLSKLSYNVFVLAPGLIILALLVKERGGWRRILAAAGAWALVAGWWHLAFLNDIWRNLGMSTQRELDLPGSFTSYFLEAPEVLVLFALALAAAPLGLRGFPRARRGAWLLVVTLVAGVGALLFLFDCQARYLLPLHAVAMVLLCTGGAALLRGARRRTRRLVLLATIPGLVVFSAQVQSKPGDESAMNIFNPRGLPAADERDFSGYLRAHRWLRERAPVYLLLVRGQMARTWMFDQQVAALEPDEVQPVLSVVGLEAAGGGSGAIHVIEIYMAPGGGGEDPTSDNGAEPALVRTFLSWESEVLATFADDSGLLYRVHRVSSPGG